MTEDDFWRTIPTVNRDIFLRTVTSFNELDPNEVSYSDTFEGLGMDSLDFIECAMFLENDFKTAVDDEDLEKVRTVGDLATLFNRALSKDK